MATQSQTVARADEDLACAFCHGSGHVCTRCGKAVFENPEFLEGFVCMCGMPAMERCGLCGGLGDC